jgi:hypothetical protein
MANKMGILNGFLLVFVNALAEIPLGISFTVGFTSYAGIPLMFATDGITKIFAWGTSEAGWWLNLGIAGISGLIFESVLVISCILSFIGSWIDGERGKKIMGAILIVELIGFIFLIIDILFIGSLGFTIAISSLFTTLGGGTYLFLLIIILQIIAIKTHIKDL